MNTRPPFENFPAKPGYFGLFADFLSAGQAAAFTATAISSGAASVLDTIPGGVLKLAAAATTDDSGVNYQATNSGFGLVLDKELWFLSRVRFDETTSTDVETQSDFFAGFSVMDTSIVASAPSAGIYFRKDDGDALLDCVVRGASAEVAVVTGVATLVSDTWYELAIRIAMDPSTSGKGTVTYYVDGTQVASVNASSLPMYSASMLAPFVAFQSGNATGTKWLEVDYIGAQQKR